MSRIIGSAFVAILVAIGCAPPVEEVEREGLGVLGYGSHDVDEVDVRTIADADDGLREPRDLDFNPAVPGELWIVNLGDDSTVTVSDGVAVKRIDPYAMHFMEEVSSISFARDDKFATCQESRNTYNGQAAPNDFMGPTLWSADPAVFAKSNPEAIAENGFDLGSHLDMLHESPLCMGIAWERANLYFTFDGLDGRISRYDFGEDHGPGFDDHSDGTVERYVDVDVARVEGVPSHMVFHRDSGKLYVADTGNARIGVLDPSGAAVARTYGGFETPIQEMEGASWTTLVDSDAGDLEAPSGIALYEDTLFVTDNATSRVTAFSLDGERLDWLDVDVPAGALMGLRADGDGALFVVDNLGERVLEIRARDDE
jgi:DNA-binding beta-propeller fold protein YncE